MDSTSKLREALDPERLRRLGAALWFSVGTRIQPSDLSWANGLFGDDADRLLWESLCEAYVVDADGVVQAASLARWLEALSHEEQSQPDVPRVVWTLPERHPAAANLGASYIQAMLAVVASAQHNLLMASPFIYERGVQQLVSSITQALYRNVWVTIITHDADLIASAQSTALEAIRHEAERLGKRLDVYTAALQEHSLLHAKVIVADEASAIIGSANLTNSALETNLEAGVVLGAAQAREVRHIFQQLIESGLAQKVFSTDGYRINH
jgi:phosphatidylserine/phosphatidylglycerophosphate/cardiolipin synthase-like enzyme